jgi:hypothetical protein
MSISSPLSPCNSQTSPQQPHQISDFAHTTSHTFWSDVLAVIGRKSKKFNNISHDDILRHPLRCLISRLKTRKNILAAFIKSANITTVIDTQKKETLWVCILAHCIQSWCIPKRVAESIIANQHNPPVFVVERRSCMLRNGMSNPPFRYVHWKGFGEPTIEPAETFELVQIQA